MKAFLLALLFGVATALVRPQDKAALNALATATSINSWTVKTNWQGTNTTDPCTGFWHGVLCNTNNSFVEVVFLGFNNLGGTLPTNIGDLNLLTDFMVQTNNIGSTLPTQIGLLSRLRIAYIFDNAMTGPLPTELGLITTLTKFDFSNNLFSGSLPIQISALTALTQFIGTSNSLSGVLPTQFASLPAIQLLALGNNQLSGTLPEVLATGPSHLSLQFIELNNNRFSGAIPENYARFTNLATFNLADNLIGCFVPDFIVLGGFFLNITGNNFVCPIPSSLIGSADSPTCTPAQIISLDPDTIYTDYSGTFTITGTDIQTNCDFVIYWISSRGTIVQSAITSITSSSITFGMPPTALGGAQQYTIEVHQSLSGKRLGGIVWRVSVNSRCPGYLDPVNYPNNGCGPEGRCLNNGICLCNRNWQGDKCDLSCSNVPNFTCVHGTCFFVGGNGAPVCACDSGWVGEGCDIELCTPACVNGVCNIDLVSGTGSCVCDAGWEGPTCEDEPPCPVCDAGFVCTRENANGERYTTGPICACENPDAIETIEGDCLTSAEVEAGKGGTPFWVWIIVAIAILIVIGIAVFVWLKCRFKPPTDTEMNKM